MPTRYPVTLAERNAEERVKFTISDDKSAKVGILCRRSSITCKKVESLLHLFAFGFRSFLLCCVDMFPNRIPDLYVKQ